MREREYSQLIIIKELHLIVKKLDVDSQFIQRKKI